LIGVDGRPSQRAPDKDVPPELDALCAQALAVNRDARTRSAEELHHGLSDYLDGERDQERRGELLERHVARALALREGATTGHGIEQRVQALRELNAALALDPKHPAALGALVELLEDIPSRLPRQVEIELARAGAEERLRAARRATLGYLTIALTVLVLLLANGKSSLFLGMILAFASAAGLHTFIVGPARGRPVHAALSLLLSALTVGSLSLLFGPLVMAPTVALAMAVTIVVHSRARPGIRWLVGGSYTLALVGFELLELLSLLSPAYAFESGSLLVLPRALSLGEGGALLLLSLAALLSLWVPTLLVGRSIDALANAERRQAAQLWLLRRLLPEAH
jgi:serine/threonine-protein kinase